MRETEKDEASDDESSGSDEDDPQTPKDDIPSPREYDQPFQSPAEEDQEAARDPRTRVLSVLELENLFFQVAPDLTSTTINPLIDRANVLPSQPSRMLPAIILPN